MSGLIAPVARLIEEFSKLPGVGRKTAQRLTYHMLRAPADEAQGLAAALVAVKEEVAYCSTCCNITDRGVDPCAFCADPRRDPTRICVVEEPLDVLAIDRTGEYRGRYHVLHGAISPATAMYLADLLDPHVPMVSRIARGLPVGGDLEYADDVTLIRSLQGRRQVERS